MRTHPPPAADAVPTNATGTARREEQTVPGPARQAFERRSAPLLVYITALPRWVPLVATLALVAVGLLVHGVVGFLALLVLAAFLGWLVVLSWPTLTAGPRVLRLVAVAILLAGAVLQLR